MALHLVLVVVLSLTAKSWSWLLVRGDDVFDLTIPSTADRSSWDRATF